MGGSRVGDRPESTHTRVCETFREYWYDYLATTHRQAFLAWSTGIILSFFVEVSLIFTYPSLPLAKLAGLRVLILIMLYWVYSKRVQYDGPEQLPWIGVNFFAFAILVGWLATIVDSAVGFPVYATAGFVITSACAHYPLKPPANFIFPMLVAGLFSGSYLLLIDSSWPYSLIILSVLLTTSPLSTSFGSTRLHNSLRDAYELNRRLSQEFKLTTEAKARLSVTLTSISDALLATDRQGRIELANPQACVLLGREAPDLIGAHIEDVLQLESEDGGNVQILLGSHWASPAHAFLSGDRSLPLRIVASPIQTSSGQVAGSVVVMQDLSELWEQEEKRMNQIRLESLGVLAGGIAHDFNNVLTAIQGNISLIELEVDQGSPVRNILMETDVALQRASQLSHQLLTFSKGGEPFKRPLAVAPLVREATELHAKGTPVTVTLELEQNLMSEIDPAQMNQVFQNLIINAVQAMPEGGHLAITLKEVEGELRVQFSDSGPGVADEIKNKIFDPYFSTKEFGTGLGLATAYSVARKHGGELALVSSGLGGASFLLSLPLAQVNTSSQEVLRQEKRLLRALVMDDEPGVRNVTCRMLQRINIDAVGAADGAEALALYQQAQEDGKPFSLVLVDLTVPEGMGGKDMMSKLLKIDPEAKAVVASGYSTDPVMSNWAEHGFVGALHKPYGFQQLKDVLDELQFGIDYAQVSGALDGSSKASSKASQELS